VTAPPLPAMLTDVQLAGEACICCGESGGFLHPDGTITIRHQPSAAVVNEYATVVCTQHLRIHQKGARYLVTQLPADDRGRVLWGIRDLHHDARWVETGGEVERHTMADGALGWVLRQRYIEERAHA